MESTTEEWFSARRRPVSLPKNWGDWGKGAVYFVSSKYVYEGIGGEAISIYAINTEDECLPVYHVMDFPCEPGNKASEAACAVLGSRVYVVAGECMWFCDIGGGGSADWEMGRYLNGVMTNPQLFTLGGSRLYALDFVLRYESSGHSFQVLVDTHWLSLDDPPLLFPTNDDYRSVRDCTIRGLSCIDDSSQVILHVSTAQGPEPWALSFKQHFLSFRLTDDCEGEWTILNIKLSESLVPNPFSDDLRFIYRSHLVSGEPLILPVVPEKLHAFGLFASSHPPELLLEYAQEVDTSDPDSAACEWWKSTVRIWNLFRVAGKKRRYCAIAFPQPADHRDYCRGGFFVLSFNLDVLAAEEMDVDGSDTSASSSKLTIEHVYQCFGVQHPRVSAEGSLGAAVKLNRQSRSTGPEGSTTPTRARLPDSATSMPSFWGSSSSSSVRRTLSEDQDLGYGTAMTNYLMKEKKKLLIVVD